MNRREKMLIGAVACLALLFIGRMFYGSYTKGLTKHEGELSKSNKELHDVNVKLAVAQQAEKKLTAWRAQSLPGDAEHPNDPKTKERAFALYSKWLSDTLEKDGLKPEKTDRSTTTALSSTNISTIGVSVRTKGSLTALVEFLYHFYSAPQLQQITRLELRPDANKPDSMNLTMTFQFEALLLPNATNTKVPAEGKLNPFKLSDVADYRVAIGRRQIFTPYKRPTPAIAGPGPGAVDLAVEDTRLAKFTGTHLGTKGLIAWIYRMNTGDTLLVSEGDAVNIGAWKGKVVSVEPRAVTLERDGKRTRVDIGALIKDGKAVAPPQKPAAPADSDEDGDGGDINAAEPEANL